jgi:hypothetical protein
MVLPKIVPSETERILPNWVSLKRLSVDPNSTTFKTESVVLNIALGFPALVNAMRPSPVEMPELNTKSASGVSGFHDFVP